MVKKLSRSADRYSREDRALAQLTESVIDGRQHGNLFTGVRVAGPKRKKARAPRL